MFTISGFKVVILKSKVIASNGKVTCIFKTLEEALEVLL